MTAKRKRKRASPKAGPAWRAAEAYGCDMSLIEDNLSRTPLERLRALDRALETIFALRQAMKGSQPALGLPLDWLMEHGVEFVLVGEYAAAGYGVTGVALGMEVCFRFSPENLMRLQEALADLRPVHRMTPAKIPLKLTPEECRGLNSLYLRTDYGQLDCISEVTGVGDFDAVKKESITIKLPSGACRILSIDALIRAKEAVGRPRDKEAVLQLKAIRERRCG